MSLSTGSVIDARYELVERLGQGGQGSVWRALDRSTGVQRALKIIDLGEGDEEAAQRAHREAHVVRGLRHPSLVDCHSVVDILQERLLVLVFELVDATPLSEARGDSRLGRVHWLAALRNIAGALAHLHRNGVVHRDLKPDNILVTPLFWEDPAAPGNLKIIDFGIAAPRRGPEGATLSGRFGTPTYMAPELFVSPGLEEQRSPGRDVFAFGVIAWELLEGSHPAGLPRGSSASAFAVSYQALRSGRAPWPPHAPKGAWGSVISACLALDPASRPADGGAILALLGDSSQTPHPPEVSGRRSHPSKAPDLEGSTDSHKAPRVEAAPEPTVPSAPTTGVLSTERAIASSLPRASGVERTTPMPPEGVSSSAPQGTAEPPKRPETEENRGQGATAPKRARSWSWLLGVVAAAAIAPVVWIGMHSDPPPLPTSTSIAAPAPTLPPPTRSALDASAPDASPSDASAPRSPREVCCGALPGCLSTKKCPKECEENIPDRDFALRVVGLTDTGNNKRDDQDIYQEDTLKPEERDMARTHPKAKVCFRTRKDNEECVTMREVATRGGVTLRKLRVSIADFTSGNVRFRILNPGLEGQPRAIGQVQAMKTIGLCRGWRLKDADKRIRVSFFLEDPGAVSSPSP